MVRWLKSADFDYVVEASSMDWDKTMGAFEALAHYEFPMRFHLMRETISATIGGAPPKEKPERD